MNSSVHSQISMHKNEEFGAGEEKYYRDHPIVILTYDKTFSKTHS